LYILFILSVLDLEQRPSTVIETAFSTLPTAPRGEWTD